MPIWRQEQDRGQRWGQEQEQIRTLGSAWGIIEDVWPGTRTSSLNCSTYCISTNRYKVSRWLEMKSGIKQAPLVIFLYFRKSFRSLSLLHSVESSPFYRFILSFSFPSFFSIPHFNIFTTCCVIYLSYFSSSSSSSIISFHFHFFYYYLLLLLLILIALSSWASSYERRKTDWRS